MQPETTLDILARVRAGDRTAVEDLFARYEPRVRRWAHGRLPSAARGALDTHDLVQEVLLRVFGQLENFDPAHPGAFRHYVWTTLWNVVRDMRRKYQRRGPTDPVDDDIPAHAPTPLEEAVGAEFLDRYEAAMMRLRPEEREILIMRIELGFSMAEIAQAMGKPSAAAAHMAVARALKRLAEEMAHVHPPAR